MGHFFDFGELPDNEGESESEYETDKRRDTDY